MRPLVPLRRLARWAGRHPVITCQLANLLAAGCAVLWLRSYAYHELPLVPYKPVCYDQERRDNLEDPLRELDGEITLEFASALLAEAVKYEWRPMMVSGGKIFITGAKAESGYLIEEYGEASRLKSRWAFSERALQRVFAGREGMDYADLANWKAPEDTIMHKKYGMPLTSTFGLTDCTFMVRVMIVGGDLNLPKKFNIPKEDADQ